MKWISGIVTLCMIVLPLSLIFPLWEKHPVFGILSGIIGVWILLIQFYYLDKIAREEGRKEGYRSFLDDVARQIAEERG